MTNTLIYENNKWGLIGILISVLILPFNLNAQEGCR